MVALARTDNCSQAVQGSHATYNVGPGQTYTELTQVPWLSLVAGDVVNIYYRATPYRTKFALRAQGTASQPVRINGVTDASCNRPEISGDGAMTAADAVQTQFHTDIQGAGLIQIHRGSGDSDAVYQPQHIRIENLKLTGAHMGKTFTGVGGTTKNYDQFSAAIYAVRVAHLTVENCEITANGLGVFTNSRGYSPVDFSAYTVIRRNKIHLNGTRFDTEHNLYIQSYRALYEGNYIGAVAGNGSSLKDRSSGTVIRYNHIVSGARGLDLVESEEEESTIKKVRSDVLYPHAWVYGNLIENDMSKPSYSERLIHWGFDNTIARARTGTLNFYHNTLMNRSYYDFNDKPNTVYRTTIFHMNPGATAVIEARSNVFTNYGKTGFQNSEYHFITEAGRVNLRGTNVLPQPWMLGQASVTGVLDQTGATSLEAADAGLDANYRPLPTSSMVLNRGTGALASAPSGAALANLQVTHQFAAPLGWVARPTTGSAPDLGAFELP